MAIAIITTYLVLLTVDGLIKQNMFFQNNNELTDEFIELD